MLFAEGGGGRPGDEWPTPAGLDTTTFTRFGTLNGRVPTIGVVSGRCFAGNAALLGSCDVIIAAEGSNIGMGGPAMIEGGGLGVFRPEDVGPMSVQVPTALSTSPSPTKSRASASPSSISPISRAACRTGTVATSDC